MSIIENIDYNTEINIYYKSNLLPIDRIINIYFYEHDLRTFPEIASEKNLNIKYGNLYKIGSLYKDYFFSQKITKIKLIPINIFQQNTKSAAKS